MKIYIEKCYDPDCDPNYEASKLDDFLKSVYRKGTWRKSQKGLEVIL